MMVHSQNPNNAHLYGLFTSSHVTALPYPAQGGLPAPRSMMKSGAIALLDGSQASLSCKTGAITTITHHAKTIAQSSNPHRTYGPKHRA